MPSSAGGGGAGGWSGAGHPGHRRIHQRSVCREMLASAVPEVRALSGRQDLGRRETFPGRERDRELAVGGQGSGHTAAKRQAGRFLAARELHGSGSDKHHTHRLIGRS